METPKNNNLPGDLLFQVCSVIMDTGFLGDAEQYVWKFYKKPFSELTVTEAQLIVQIMGKRKGSLKNIGPEDPIPLEPKTVSSGQDAAAGEKEES